MGRSAAGGPERSPSELWVAIDQALDTEDWSSAVELIRQAGGPALRSGHPPVILAWFARLPADCWLSEPDLAVLMARAAGFEGDTATAESIERALRAGLIERGEAIPTGIRAGLLHLQFAVRLWEGDFTPLISLARELQAVVRTDPADPMLAELEVDTVMAEANLAQALLLTGHLDEALGSLDSLLTPEQIVPPTRAGMIGVGLRALALAWSDQDARAREAVREGLPLLERFSGSTAEPIALLIAAAWVCDLPDAEAHLEGARIFASHPGYPFMQVLTMLAAARVALRRGSPDVAQVDLDAAEATMHAMVDPGFLPHLAESLRQQATASATSGESLTQQELASLRAVGAGMSRADAARALNYSVNTVKTHLRNAYRKLGASNLQEALERSRASGQLTDGR